MKEVQKILTTNQPSRSVAPVIAVQLPPSSPESVKVSSKRRNERPSEVNFDEILQLPSQPTLSSHLPNGEIQVLNQPSENRDVDASMQSQNLHDSDYSVYAESDIEDEQIDDEDDLNLEDIVLPEENPSHSYIGYRAHQSAHKLFHKMFVKNPFGHVCKICDCLWFLNDLKPCHPDDENLLKQITVGQIFNFFKIVIYLIPY